MQVLNKQENSVSDGILEVLDTHNLKPFLAFLLFVFLIYMSQHFFACSGAEKVCNSLFIL